MVEFCIHHFHHVETYDECTVPSCFGICVYNGTFVNFINCIPLGPMTALNMRIRGFGTNKWIITLKANKLPTLSVMLK